MAGIIDMAGMKKLLYVLCLLAQGAVSQAAVPLPEHPRPDWMRAEWLNLNGAWDFGFAQGRYDRKIVVPFGWGSPLSGVKDEGDVGYYRRTVVVPADWKGSRTFLVVGACDWEAEVFVNGESIGVHRGGYTPFEFELTGRVARGKPFVLEIRCWDEPSATADGSFRLYGKQGYGNVRGIWQTVYIESRGRMFVDCARMIPSVRDSSVTAELTLDSPARDPVAATVAVDGTEAEVKFAPGERTKSVRIALGNPRVWDLGHPNLYDVTLRVADDCVQTYFGLREVGVGTAPNGERYVTLNGKPVYLQLCLDQGYDPNGYYTFPSDEAMKEEILISKRLALSGNRVHIKVEVPRKLYWADKLGLLVMADVPNAWGPVSDRMFEEHAACFDGMLRRDFNHPSIFCWVLFNETWGLFSVTSTDGSKTTAQVSDATYARVLEAYRRAKAADPTRLVEDNSPCHRDHTRSDLNSWHGYFAGFIWEDVVSNACARTFPGSEWNCARGFVQGDAPMLNSECGNIWGYKASTGDVDWSWDYHLMLNGFRRHTKCSGWLYTQHHDVLNEWTGYVRDDRTLKETGFEELYPGMSVVDLHAPAYLPLDRELCRSFAPGDTYTVPVDISLVTDAYAGRRATLAWQMRYLDQRGRLVETGWRDVPLRDATLKSWQLGRLADVPVSMPNAPACGTINFALAVGGTTIARNFQCFSVLAGGATAVPSSTSWSLGEWTAMEGEKRCGAGSGYFEYAFDKSATRAVFRAEVSTKRLNGKDAGDNLKFKSDMELMVGGGTHDRSKNPNSYPMTSSVKHAGAVRVYANGVLVKTIQLPDDPADSRGILSWMSQKRAPGRGEQSQTLDEAGSYGYLVEAEIPKSVLDSAEDRVVVRLEAEKTGLAVYGERAGRYPFGPHLAAKEVLMPLPVARAPFARKDAGKPATGGVDFWAGDAIHVPVSPTRNVMANGSFEQNWKGWCWGYGGARNIRTTPEKEHFAIVDGGMDGGKALRIRPSQYGVIWLKSASVPTIPGKTYTLSWYARSTNAVGSVSVMQCSAGAGGRYKWLRKSEPVRLKPEWRRFSSTFEGDSAGVFIRVDGFDALVDRIMLEEGAAMTDYVEDPVLARLVTSNPDNDLRPGCPIDARLELTGMKAVRAKLRVIVKNYYSEVVYNERFDVDVAADGSRTTVPLALDPAKLGTGVFVVRMDFKAAGASWTDYRRFVVSEPLDNKHATARFFCGMPWFRRVDRSVDVARKMKEYGFGSLGAQDLGNAGYYADENTASLCRENDFKLVLHPVLYELPLPEMNKWHGLEEKDLTEDLFKSLEALAYKSARECAPEDTLWTFFNEEEKMARRIGFENHWRLVETAYRGCRRAFDERGLKLRFAPTHGVSHYFLGRNYDTVDAYLETAKKHGFMYDAVTIHSYQNIDGSILGPKDAEVETQHLIDRMKHYGYPDETPILLSESFNMLPWRIPAWGAEEWADRCWTGPASEDLGNREFVHAGAMARLYLLALKFYPKVAQVNTWPHKINVAFLNHDLQPFAWLKMVNTLGHLFPDPEYYGGARPYADVRGHVYLQDDNAILAVWTSNNDVERGTRRGATLKMDLPGDVRFVDLMGNERRGGGEVPLTPAPLFVVSARDNAESLLQAVRAAQTDDLSQAIEAEVRPTVDGAIALDLANATSVPQKADCGGGNVQTIAANAGKTIQLAPPRAVRPMEMYAFTTNFQFLAKPWKVSYFYVPKCGAKPDWSKVPSLPIANEVRRSPEKPVTMKADYKLAWNGERLFLRVEVEDDVVLRKDAYSSFDLRHLYLVDQCLEVYFDAFADARKASTPGFDMNDSRYDLSSGSVWRMRAVNWQLAQGTVSATDEEVSERLEQTCTPTEKGCVYEVAFPPRYLAPIELKAGTRASLGLYVHDRDTLEDKGENGLSNSTERGKVCNLLPHLWPEFILMP